MRIALHSIILAIGVFLVGYGGISQIRPITVWSDFKAFSGRVAADATARHVLAYGGERDGTDFDDLLGRVWRLSDDWKTVISTGMVLCGVGIAGIATEIIQRRRNRIIQAGPNPHTT